VLNAPDGDQSRTTLALTYYFEPNANLLDGTTCTSSTCLVSAGFISSDDGGRSWDHANKIAGPMPESWLVTTYAGEMVAGVNRPHSVFESHIILSLTRNGW
jgi:hypothetical protein